MLGAALLPLPAFGQGSIVYVNPPDARIGDNSTPQSFDLDGDGVSDVVFGRIGGQLNVIPAGINQVSATANLPPEAGGQALPIPIGNRIDTATPWQSRYPDALLGDFGPMLANDYSIPATGPFAGVDGYLGIRFAIGTEPHYGWIRLKMDSVFPNLARGYVTEWAYNTVPDQPIAAGVVPEPSTWVLLTLGLFSMWRFLGLSRRRFHQQ